MTFQICRMAMITPAPQIPLSYRLRKYRLRKEYEEHFSGTSQQIQAIKIRNAESTETRLPNLTALPEIVPDNEIVADDEIVANVESIISLPSLPQASQAQAIFHALQEWEGHVLEKRDNEFIARLLDLTAGSAQEEEEVAIPLAEISEDDLKRLRKGSIFRWVIGYELSVSKTKRRISQIVFRDLPAMTQQDFSQGEKWAKQIIQALVD